MPELDADVPEVVTELETVLSEDAPFPLLVVGASKLLAQAGKCASDALEADDFEDKNARENAILSLGVITGAFGALKLGFPWLTEDDDTEGDET